MTWPTILSGDAKMPKKPITPLDKLNLACGQTKTEGFIGVDIVKTPAVDVVHDLLKFPWPFKSSSVSETSCSHFIEHIPMLCNCCRTQKDPWFQFFDELYRVLIPDGTASFVAPYYSSVRAWQDPTHRRAISEASFLYLNKQWREVNGLQHYNVDCNFDFSFGYAVENDTMIREENARAFRVKYYINTISDIQVTLVKK